METKGQTRTAHQINSMGPLFENICHILLNKALYYIVHLMGGTYIRPCPNILKFDYPPDAENCEALRLMTSWLSSQLGSLRFGALLTPRRVLLANNGRNFGTVSRWWKKHKIRLKQNKTKQFRKQLNLRPPKSSTFQTKLQ